MKLYKEAKITILYIIFGLSWILFSDILLKSFINDQNLINKIQSYKGGFYVIITAFLLYIILHKTLKNIRNQKEKLQENYEQLEADNEEFQALNEKLEESYLKMNNMANNIEKMINITSSLDSISTDNTDEFLSDLLNTSLKLISEADNGAIAKIQDNELIFVDTEGYNIKNLNKLSLTKDYLKSLNGIKSLSHFLNDSSQHKESSDFYNMFKEHLKMINDSLIVSFNDGQEKVGMLCLTIDNQNNNKFDYNSQRVISAFSSLANGFFKIQKYHQVEAKFQKELIIAITHILELHDTYTDGHSKEVADISQKIAEKLDLPEKDIEKAYWAGMVHDIGKILIPKSILNKNGPLTNKEYDMIKKHSVWGYQALEHSNRLNDIAKIILHHHERFDGKGYPYKLKKDEIPLISKILSVADSWDAMRSDRSYRTSLPVNEALNEIKVNKDTQFCPKVVEAFLELHNQKIFDTK